MVMVTKTMRVKQVTRYHVVNVRLNSFLFPLPLDPIHPGGVREAGSLEVV